MTDYRLTEAEENLADIMYAAKPAIHSGITRIDRVVNNSLPTPVITGSVNPIQIWLLLGQIIWLAGILIFLIYSILTTLVGSLKSEITDLKLKKEKDIIHASFKAACYLAGNLIEEKAIDLDFVLKKIEGKIYIDSINGDLSYIPMGYENQISQLPFIIR